MHYSMAGRGRGPICSYKGVRGGRRLLSWGIGRTVGEDGVSVVSAPVVWSGPTLKEGGECKVADDWDPQSIQEELDLEMMGVRTEGGEVVGKTHEQVSKEIAVKTAPFAMKRIAWIACYSDNEGTALKAADLILNRVFGKVSDVPLMTGSEQDLLREMVDSAYGRGPQDD